MGRTSGDYGSVRPLHTSSSSPGPPASAPPPELPFHPQLQVFFLFLAATERATYHVHDSSLELLLELLFPVRFVAWLPPEEFPCFFLLSSEALLVFRVCSPAFSTSLDLAGLHLCQLLAQPDLVFACGLDMEAPLSLRARLQHLELARLTVIVHPVLFLCVLRGLCVLDESSGSRKRTANSWSGEKGHCTCLLHHCGPGL